MAKTASIESKMSLKSGKSQAPTFWKSILSEYGPALATFAVVLLALAGLIVAARPGTAPAPASRSAPAAEARSQGTLSAREARHDFGAISMAAGKVTHRFEIRNTGVEPVLIRKMYTSCMCTTASLIRGGRKTAPSGMPGHGLIATLNESLDMNERALVEVVFDPAAHGPSGVGPTERIVTIQNNAGGPLELMITALVKP